MQLEYVKIPVDGYNNIPGGGSGAGSSIETIPLTSGESSKVVSLPNAGIVSVYITKDDSLKPNIFVSSVYDVTTSGLSASFSTINDTGYNLVVCYIPVA